MAGTPLRVLLVEDSDDDALLFERHLVKAGFAPQLVRVESEPEMSRALDSGPFEVVLSDYVLPKFGGLAALEVLRRRDRETPFILTSGKVEEECAVAAMRSGAQDFISKSKLARLGPAIERELSEADDRRRRRQAEVALREAEDKLERARRLEYAGTITAQVAHDLKNLLTPLAVVPTLLRKRQSADAVVQRHCDTLERIVRGLNGLVDDLLTLGRRGRIQKEAVDLNQVVEEALHCVSEFPATIALKVELAPRLDAISGAPPQLSRVVTNLIHNAVDALPAGGTIRVRTAASRFDGPVGRQGQVPPGDYVTLEVADSGSGIPSEHLEHIFEPFFSTKTVGRGRGGSGLGLSIVQAVVGDSGGSVDVVSTPGQGTAFTLYFPAAASRSNEKSASNAAPLARPSAYPSSSSGKV